MLNATGPIRRILTSLFVMLFALGALFTAPAPSAAQQGGASETALDSLKQQLEALQSDLQALRESSASQRQAVLRELARMQTSPTAEQAAGDKDALHLGGYGEVHMNATEGSTGEMLDLHRMVVYLGYTFSDWLMLHSETEIEHAYVKGGNGYVAIEQLHLDMLLTPALNLRFGRVLIPMGIINPTHEPPTFHGVERPNVEKYIIPTTWFADGAGIFGRFGSNLTYQAYVLSGMDATGFTADEGIRGGRLKERPGITDPTFTGSVDLTLPAASELMSQTKLGLGVFHGGGNNGNKGSVPDVDVDVNLFSADLRTRVAFLHLRGLVAYGSITNAEDLGNGTASEIFGYYAEGAVDILPDGMKTGRLERASLFAFARYENYDTQFGIPTGVSANEAWNRTDVTLGLTFLPTENVSLKADYQVASNGADTDLPNRFNLGVGWMF